MNEVVILIPIVNMPQNRTEEQLVLFMAMAVQTLIDLGALKGTVDDILKDYYVDEATNYINIKVPQDAIGLTNELETVGAATCPTYKVVTDIGQYIDPVDGEIKTFSAATINERLRIAMRNAKLRFRYTIMDYKKFYKQKESMLKKNSEMAQKLRNMFLTDVMGMFTEVLPQIEEGKQLATLVGTSQVTSKLNKVARELSLAYRKALKMEKSSGQINKGAYSRLKKAYTEFMNELMDQVFPEMNSEQKEESRRYSFCKDGRIDLFAEPTEQIDRDAEEEVLDEETRALNEDLHHFEEESQKEYSDGMTEVTFRTTNPELLTNIVNAIGECGNGGHTFDIIIDPDLSEEDGGNKKFQWDGDGSDRVEVSEDKSFSSNEVKTKDGLTPEQVVSANKSQCDKLVKRFYKEYKSNNEGFALKELDECYDECKRDFVRIDSNDKRWKSLLFELASRMVAIEMVDKKATRSSSATFSDNYYTVYDNETGSYIGGSHMSEGDANHRAEQMNSQETRKTGKKSTRYSAEPAPSGAIFSEAREKVSAKMLEKAKTDGVVQKKPNGSWGIISIDAGEWWTPDYESEEKAKNALEAYHANKFNE